MVHTGGCSAEHVFGSTDEKGSWLDGHLLRRLRVLAEGNRGSATNPGTGRHRACGVGTGDVCPHPSGSATSGFSHGCKSRLLVLDGPISKLLEGIFAGDPASGSSLTGLEVRKASISKKLRLKIRICEDARRRRVFWRKTLSIQAVVPHLDVFLSW